MNILDETETVRQAAYAVLDEAFPYYDADEIREVIEDLAQAGVLKDPATEHENRVQLRAEAVREAAEALPDETAYPKQFLRDYADIIEGYYEGG